MKWEHTPTPSIVSTFGFTFESFKECKGASSYPFPSKYDLISLSTQGSTLWMEALIYKTKYSIHIIFNVLILEGDIGHVFKHEMK
jgi:hypothetical protein